MRRNNRSEFLQRALVDEAAQPGQVELRRIELEPFDIERSMKLALALIERRVAAPELVAGRIAHESGGVPFFVCELASYYLETLVGDQTKFSLTELLARRLHALTDSERHALELLSLAARPVEDVVLSRAVGDSPGTPRSLRVLALLGLANAGVQRKWVVYHDRLRDLITRRLPERHARTLHRELALAYESAGLGEPEWLIEHWSEAGEPSRARDYATKAAARAAAKLEECYRFQLGRITPGREGGRLLRRAETKLRELGVVVPERWSRMIVAGLGRC